MPVAMYLTAVLNDIKRESAPPKTLHAEHLYKLNEAVFNLPEEDTVDTKMTLRLFQTVEKIRIAYNSGKYDNSDSNFFYDYLALLGTMQNQHFFSLKQTEKMLEWIKEVVDQGQESAGGKGDAKGDAGKKAKKGGAVDFEAENRELKAELATLKKYRKAVDVIRGVEASSEKKAAEKDEPHASEKPAKGKGKGKGKAEPEPEVEAKASKAKGKGKGKEEKESKEKAKGKGKGGEPAQAEPKAKAKAKAKAKGKGKGDDDSESEDERPKGKSKGKGKGGKNKGDDSESEDERPKGKAKGKGKDGKGKGKASAHEESEDDEPRSKGKGKGKEKGKEKGKDKGKGAGKSWTAKGK